MLGATDPQSLGVLVPGPVKNDTNNWAPRVGFAWVAALDNWLIGDGKTVIRGGFGIGYDVLFYNLLTVNASNFPARRNRQSFDLVGRLSEPASRDRQPRSSIRWRRTPTRPKTPVLRRAEFYSLSVGSGSSATSSSRSATTGSRGYKGINQIHVNPGDSDPGTGGARGQHAERQRDSRRPGAAPLSAVREPDAHPGLRGPGRQRRRGALGVQRGVRLGQAPASPMASSSRRATPSAVGQQQRRLARRGRHRANRASDRRACSTTTRNGASRSSIGRTGSSPATSGRFRDRVRHPAPGARRLADLRRHAVQSGRPFTIITGVDSNGDGNTGSDRPNVNPSGTFVWDSGHKTFTNNGYYVAPLGTNNLPLANGLGNGNGKRNAERSAYFWNTNLTLLKTFPAGPTATGVPCRCVQHLQPGRIRSAESQHEQPELRNQRQQLGTTLAEHELQGYILS